jgi:hypothetical protein
VTITVTKVLTIKFYGVKMSIRCYVSLPEQMAIILKFKVMPRIGDEVCVPNRSLRTFIITSVTHYAREHSEKDEPPTVQIYLQYIPSVNAALRIPYNPRRQGLPPRWRVARLML